MRVLIRVGEARRVGWNRYWYFFFSLLILVPGQRYTVFEARRKEGRLRDMSPCRPVLIRLCLCAAYSEHGSAVGQAKTSPVWAAGLPWPLWPHRRIAASSEHLTRPFRGWFFWAGAADLCLTLSRVARVLAVVGLLDCWSEEKSSKQRRRTETRPRELLGVAGTRASSGVGELP